MLKTGLKTMLLTAVAITAIASAASAGKLTIESWRNDDAAIWKEKIIPAFQAKFPDITVEFTPTAPKEYNAALNARLKAARLAISLPVGPLMLRLSFSTRAISQA